MNIGIPRALLYYRYGTMWETFFKEAGCGVTVSRLTDAAILEAGSRDAVSECCLPAKIYLGHVRSLLGRCDYILSPYALKKLGGENMCTRFWGMSDVIRNSYENARLLEYAVCENNPDAAFNEYRRMGRELKIPLKTIREAYKRAVSAQNEHDARERRGQEHALNSGGIKILVSGHPYVTHDPYIGGAVTKLISEMGAVPFYSDRFNRQKCIDESKSVAPGMYWTENREAAGAVAAYRREMDGAVLLTAFPCASDSLSCELTLRGMRDLPATLITLDGQTGGAGLETRIESFLDILKTLRS